MLAVEPAESCGYLFLMTFAEDGELQIAPHILIQKVSTQVLSH